MKVGQIIEVVRLRPGMTKEPFKVEITDITIMGFKARPVSQTAPPIYRIEFNRIGVSIDG